MGWKAGKDGKERVRWREDPLKKAMKEKVEVGWQSVVVQGGIQRNDELAFEAQSVQGGEDDFGTKISEMERRVGSTQSQNLLETEKEKQRSGQSKMWTSGATGSVWRPGPSKSKDWDCRDEGSQFM